MNTLCLAKRILVVAATCVALNQSAWAATSLPTSFTNIGSIANTRHNLTQAGSPSQTTMDASRNDYGEVCVYCHTPHGAQSNMVAPLWNRTIKVTNYQTYDELGTSTLTQIVSSTPGAASLTCLSCHDGQTAIDSVINMPGRWKNQGGAGAQTNQYTGANGAQSGTFLNTWNNPGGRADTTIHRGLNSNTSTAGSVLGNGTGDDNRGCLSCHADTGIATTLGLVIATDFTSVNLGTDLRNDHPIGITFPALTGTGTDWATPGGSITVGANTSKFFDDGDGKLEKGEIRTYENKVECASCHDPHGVPSAGAGSVFNPTFLRKVNTGSAVCLTCHVK